MIYIHIGMIRTGSTFLRTAVFSKWNDIKLSHGLMGGRDFVSLKKEQKYLISWANLSGHPWLFDEELKFGGWYQQQELFLENLSKFFPDARIMISFRRHDSYVLSLYKHYLLIGGVLPFEKVFDIENDEGIIKKSDLLFKRRLQLVEKFFNDTPFVFLQEELRSNLPALLMDMEKFFMAKAPNIHDLDLRRKRPFDIARIENRGVGLYQSKVLLQLNKLRKSQLNPNGLLPLDNRYTRRLRIDPRTICQVWLALLLPHRPITLSKRQQDFIRDYYETDWQFILDYGRKKRLQNSGKGI